MFERRFRATRDVFNRVYAKLTVLDFFVRKKAALGENSLHPPKRIVGVFRTLAYGTTDEYMCELLRTPETSMADALLPSYEALVEEFDGEHLRKSRAKDLCRTLCISEARGSPSCLGGIDCQNWLCTETGAARRVQVSGGVSYRIAYPPKYMHISPRNIRGAIRYREM